MTRIGLCIVVMLVLGGPAMALPDADTDTDCEQLAAFEEEGLFRAAECPQLFGDEDEWQANASRRRRMLTSVSKRRGEIVVVYTSDWDEPSLIDFANLTLVSTLRNPNCPKQAVVELEPGDGNLMCDEGLYLLQRGHALGGDGAVLAVLDDLVLVDYEGELRYLRTENAPAPDWRMVFRSAFDLYYPVSGKVTTTKGKGSRNRGRRGRRH